MKTGSLKQLLLIINPISGTSGSKEKLAPYITRKLEGKGFKVDTVFTAGPGDATRLACEAVEKGYYGVIACGGDGTVNEIASALRDTETALAIIPAGSGNGLARHIEIPIDVELSVKVIANDHVRRCDYCTVNGRPFFCTFGLGFDAAVSDRFARKKRRGLLTYFKSTLEEFIDFESDEYAIDVQNETLTERAFLVACCNASQYGNNAFIAPDASITDGVLDLIIVHNGNMLTRTLVGLELVTGFIRKNAFVHKIRTDSVTIRRKKPGVAHIDGEPVELPAELNVRCHPGGLLIMTPTKKTRFTPLITPLYYTLRDAGMAIGRLFRKRPE